MASCSLGFLWWFDVCQLADERYLCKDTMLLHNGDHAQVLERKPLLWAAAACGGFMYCITTTCTFSGVWHAAATDGLPWHVSSKFRSELTVMLLLLLLLSIAVLIADSNLVAGTSPVLVCALLQPLVVNLGMSLQQRQQLVKGSEVSIAPHPPSPW
jgi:hypothetical protein